MRSRGSARTYRLAPTAPRTSAQSSGTAKREGEREERAPAEMNGQRGQLEAPTALTGSPLQRPGPLPRVRRAGRGTRGDEGRPPQQPHVVRPRTTPPGPPWRQMKRPHAALRQWRLVRPPAHPAGGPPPPRPPPWRGPGPLYPWPVSAMAGCGRTGDGRGEREGGVNCLSARGNGSRGSGAL